MDNKGQKAMSDENSVTENRQLKHNQTLAIDLTAITMQNENLHNSLYSKKGDETFDYYSHLFSSLKFEDKLRNEVLPTSLLNHTLDQQTKSDNLNDQIIRITQREYCRGLTDAISIIRGQHKQSLELGLGQVGNTAFCESIDQINNLKGRTQ